MEKSIRICCLFLLTLLPMIFGACSKRYMPHSEKETVYFRKANFCLYPNDVRNLPQELWDTIAVWPSLLKRFDLADSGGGFSARLVLEHHFYDWILDYGAQKEKIFLSPSGEGVFKTQWRFPPNADTAAIRSSSKEDDMFIVYGKPKGISNDTIEVAAFYIRPIEKKWYTTKMWDYGRDSCRVNKR